MENLKIDNKDLEKLIIANLLRNETFFLKVGQYLKTSDAKKKSYFTDPKYQQALNLAYGYHKRYKKLPTKDEAFSLLENMEGDEDQKFYAKKIIENVYEIDVDGNIEYIEDQTVDFIKQARAVEAIVLSQFDIENGKYDGLDKRLRDAVNINLDKDLGTSVLDFKENFQLIREIVDESKSVSIGYPSLDMIFGRINPREIFIYGAPSGVGKSLWLAQTALSAFNEGKKVVFFSLETSVKRLLTRIYQSMFQKTTRQLLTEEGLEDKVPYYDSNGDIIFKQYPANLANANTFTAFINDLITIKGWKPDAIIVDYIGICGTNDRTMKRESTYQYYRSVTEELRNLGFQFDVPVFTAAQLNRDSLSKEGGTKKELSALQMADSKGITDTADYLALISQTKNDKTKGGDSRIGEYTILVEKNRNGNTGDSKKFIINYNHLTIDEWRENK